MATFRQVVTVLVLILVAAASFAQQKEVVAQASACWGKEVLVAFTADVQYEAACEALMTCMEWIHDFEPCVMHFYAERVAACAADDDTCVAQARLHTALIGFTVGNGYVDHGQPNEFWVELAAKIADRTVFEAANFEEAIEWYAPLYDAYSGEHPMWFYSNGVLQLLKRDPQSGFKFVEGAMWLDSENPLIYFTRGDIHAARGENELASLYYFITSAITGAPGLSGNVEAVLTGRTSIYPFSYSPAEPYLLYPVAEGREGPGGRSLSDMTLQMPYEVSLQRHGDLLLFIPGNSEAERDENPYRILLPFYALYQTNNEYRWRGQEYDTGYATRLTLTETGDGFDGERTDIVFEGTTTRQFIIVPEGSSDPRPQGFRCEGSPLTRLEGAVFATPLRWWEPVWLYDEPGGTVTQIEQDSQMLIALRGQPECLDGFTWWPVVITIESEEQGGWIQENVDTTQYYYDRIDYD